MHTERVVNRSGALDRLLNPVTEPSLSSTPRQPAFECQGGKRDGSLEGDGKSNDDWVDKGKLEPVAAKAPAKKQQTTGAAASTKLQRYLTKKVP